jgi:1-acylglycerone phosphate reductase
MSHDHSLHLLTACTNRCSHGGAGNALALEFAARGLRVFATARSLKSIANLAESGIETLALDVTDRESIAAVKTEISKRTGGTLEMLYNNAGTSASSPPIWILPAQ